METTDSTYQQPLPAQQHPPGDVLAPEPDMSATAQGVPGMNQFDILPEAHWGQWWSTGDAAYANLTAQTVFNQEQQFFDKNFYLDPGQTTRWGPPSTSTNIYPLLSPPSTEATSLGTLPDKSCRDTSATQTDQRQRKRSTAAAAKPKSQNSTTNSTRRASTRKASKAEPDTTAVSEKPRRGRRSKASTKPTIKPEQEEEYDNDGDGDTEADPEQEYDNHSKKVQERNRIASNKFRVKKREDAIKLRVDEEDMERANKDLTNCVSDLTMQVYDLKMKLLQHTDCDCALIQDYIATEAKRYIKDLGEGKHPNATPPLPPQTPFYHNYQQHHIE